MQNRSFLKMGSSFPLFSKRQSESPQFTPYSSQNYSKKGSKSQFPNRKNSYTELNSKYLLANQRWTTIRQYQKLNSMVMRNFSKIVEKGTHFRNNNTTTAIGLDFSNSETNNRNYAKETTK